MESNSPAAATTTADSSSANPLSRENIGGLFDSVDAFLFDCDGVIWRGDSLIDGVADTLSFLRSKGKNLVFVTNNSRKSRRQYSKKFQSLGITVSEDEIFTSSFAAAMFLKVNNFPQDKKVYVVGGEGILEELQLAGYTGLGGPEDGKKVVDLKSDDLFEHDKSVGAVVVGLDPQINYYKLQYGSLCIRENPGCIFVATNRDAAGHLTRSQEWPGAGAMVAAMCAVTQKEPIVVGKPSTFLMEFLLKKLNIVCSRMCMVGDRLDTDILFGQSAGCKTLLVFSGCTTPSLLHDPSNKIHPDYYAGQLCGRATRQVCHGVFWSDEHHVGATTDILQREFVASCKKVSWLDIVMQQKNGGLLRVLPSLILNGLNFTIRWPFGWTFPHNTNRQAN